MIKDELFLRALAEQAYMFHLLVQQLRRDGVLPEQRSEWSEQDFQEFFREYRRTYFGEH